MTEYTTSPEAIQEFMSSRERTAYWVDTHSPTKTQFYSPSVPPSVLDDPTASPISPPSEVGSSHSVPPKMFLKYDDGRPNVSISHWHYEGEGANRSGSKRRGGEHLSHSKSQSHNRSRSISHGPLGTANPADIAKPVRQDSRHTHEQREVHHLPTRAPEEIRVLPSPSQSSETPRSQSRSKSLPRESHRDAAPSPPPIPIPPPFHAQLQPLYTPQPVTVSQSQPLPWHVNPERNHQSYSQKYPARTPPAIVYAPAHHSKSHYTPPAIYSHPPPRNAPSMTHSHSAPTPQSHYSTTTVIPYKSLHTSSKLTSVNEEGRSRRNKSRSSRRDRSTPRHDDSLSDTESHESGSTYYVLPTAGQKVHVITTDKSISTATSTTKSPTSPRSGSSSGKKPFLLRLFGIAEKSRGSNTDSAKHVSSKPPSPKSPKSQKSSSGMGRRLVRRHSTGGGGRKPTKEQRGER